MDAYHMQQNKLFRLSKKSLFVRLLTYSIVIQIVALAIIGGFFYRNVASEILSQHVSMLEITNTEIAQGIQNRLKGVISSAYAISINNSISNGINNYQTTPDINNKIKLNTLLSDSLEDAIYQSNHFIKTALFIFDDTIYAPSTTFANNDLSIEKLAPLFAGCTEYLTFLPRQKDPIANKETTIIPIIFNIKYGRAETHLLFFLDYQNLLGDLKDIVSEDALLITDKEGRIVFEENPNLANDPSVLSTGMEFQPGIYQTTICNSAYLRTDKTIASSHWNSHLFTEKKQALREFNLLTIFLLLVFLAVFILETILYYILYHHFTNPIKDLASVMSHPMDKHNVYRKFEYKGDDEIGVLSRTYNTMIETIDQLVANLNSTIEDLRDKSEQVAWEQEQTRKAEIKALQAQINPHFLYNTLNSISWLAIEQNADKAAQLANDLATYYEISLSKGQSLIPLAKEIEHLTRYLDIEKTRYQDILSYKIDVREEFMRIPIPKITLQPLAENALYHGLKTQKTMGLLTITARTEDEGNTLVIEMKNSGQAMAKPLIDNINANLKAGLFDPDSGYGIYNVNTRLRLMLGTAYGLSFSLKDGQTCVCVRINAKGDATT